MSILVRIQALHPCGNETLNNVFLSTSVGRSLIDDDEDDDEDDDDVDAGEDDDKGAEILTAMATTNVMITMVRHRRWRRQL